MWQIQRTCTDARHSVISFYYHSESILHHIAYDFVRHTGFMYIIHTLMRGQYNNGGFLFDFNGLELIKKKQYEERGSVNAL